MTTPSLEDAESIENTDDANLRADETETEDRSSAGMGSVQRPLSILIEVKGRDANTLGLLRSAIVDATLALEQGCPEASLRLLRDALRQSRELRVVPRQTAATNNTVTQQTRRMTGDCESPLNGADYASGRGVPVKVHTLGRFNVVIDNQPLLFSAKVPRKPLELLKALIALGSRSVDINDIMKVVWRDQGSAARAAFDVTLMRLRKLLCHAESLILVDGKLTLSDQFCWVDVWSFERAITQFESTPCDNANDKVLDLYRGRFLDREVDAPWILNLRDRLAAKFRRLVLTLAKAEERAERWREAAQLYRRGLEHDNLTEEFYRRLMHCELHLGQKAEAISTYRRCRDLLSINLQTKPSAELETLHQRALAK